MSKKTRRVSVSLHPQKSGPLSNEEIKAILRGADDLIMEGGRSLLAKILKGSKDKTILEKNLTNNPSYGYYKGLSIYEITSKIDWLIINRYLEIEYSGRLPMLIYSPKGWEIEKDTYTDEILSGFDRLINIGINSFNMLYLKDRARDMIMLLLDKIQESRDSKYIPILEAWKKIDYKKVRVRIDSVIRALCK
ncbi:MAG: RQC domain protein [Actinobacteria bacterium]|nr:RQC domain protein [Actinomycetota bacterium]